jgi:AmmeMemoRadiSam system protein B
MGHTAVLGPAVAGSWYPRDRDELAGLVDQLIESAAARAPVSTGPLAGLIVPHAGFVYSGAVAASAFTRLKGRTVDRIVLIGPSHHFGFGGAAVPDKATAYRTPIGDAPIDREAVLALSTAAGFVSDDRVFEPEHALEAELPFLQRVLGRNVPIVPVLLGGRATHDDAKRAALAIAPLLHASTLVVVSSDFTHFGPRFGYVPFADDLPARIRALDLGAIAAVEACDAAAFARYVDTTGATICGHRAIDVLLMLPCAAGGAELLDYDTSGRMTGMWDNSVSYAAIAIPAAGAGAR